MAVITEGWPEPRNRITCSVGVRLGRFLELADFFVVTVGVCKPALAMLWLFDKLRLEWVPNRKRNTRKDMFRPEAGAATSSAQA